MEDKFLCVMAQYDKETERKLNLIQRALCETGFAGSQTPNLPNHITLGTFELDKENELKEQIKKVCSNTPKIQTLFNNIGLFGMEVLFIAPSVTHELLNLQHKFSKTYAYGSSWTAHTTMLIDKPDEIQKALPIVAKNFSPFSGYIESISLYEFWPTRFILEEKLT
ncbi:MAG: 2-5 ligase [Clostridiaceae bacterium]|jgi:2'-5' RNA ligase|nr:2-5 ligase [Clostridiaceae bacterium]